MSLSAFLEFGGEAVIRGLLSTLDPGVVIQRGKLTELAYGFVVEKLRRKGRDISGIPESSLRKIIGETARSMQQAGRYQGPSSSLPTINEIPKWHAPNGPDKLTYTVRIRIIMPDGTPADVVTIVTSDDVLSQGQVFSAAVENMSKRFNIVSDPRRAARGGVEIQSYSILSIYRGQPT